jgi:type II secretory pathway predicted ATPase ExeA
MYEAYYGLNKKPFQITSDPGFLWMGKKHREALSTLKYGVMDNKGFLLLTGDVGTGKTTLINHLAQDIQDRAYIAKILDPALSKYDFYRMVCQCFNLLIEVKTKSDFLGPFSQFLNDAHRDKRSVLLLIDEAQRLKHDLMEEIRLLSNLERQDTKLLNIFFVGQNEFNSILLQPENRALMRRINTTYNLDTLDPAETGEYIRHRLVTAGAGYDIFSNDAVQAVYEFSCGFPRQINIICDLSMYFASRVKKKTISRKIVNQCRERVCFDMDEPPAKRPSKILASAPVTRHQPTKKKHRPIFPAIRKLGYTAVLLLVGTGIYFGPDQLRTQARHWVRETYRTYFSPSYNTSATAQPTIEVFNSATATAETASPGATSNGPATAIASELPLPLPRQPPEVEFSQPVKTSPEVAPDVQPATLTIPPDTVATSSGNRPDPADAIDWLLKKRNLKID